MVSVELIIILITVIYLRKYIVYNQTCMSKRIIFIDEIVNTW